MDTSENKELYEKIALFIEQKFHTEFEILRQLSKIPNLIPTLSKLCENYQPTKEIKKPNLKPAASFRLTQNHKLKTSDSEENNNQKEGKAKIPAFRKSRNTPISSQKTVPEPKTERNTKESKKENKKEGKIKSSTRLELPSNKKPNKRVSDSGINFKSEDSKKPTKKESKKEVKKELKKEIKKTNRKPIKPTIKNEDISEEIPEKINENHIENISESLPKNETQIEEIKEQKEIDSPMKTPEKHLEPEEIKDLKTVVEQAKLPENVEKPEMKIVITPSANSENEQKINDHEIFAGMMKVCFGDLQEMLPVKRILPQINREYLQIHLSELLKNIRKQLVEHVKSMQSESPEHDANPAEFKFSPESLAALGKIRESNLTEFFEKSNEKEQELLRYLVYLADNILFTEWEKLLQFIKEKIVTIGLHQYITEKFSNIEISDDRIFKLRKYLQNKPYVLNDLTFTLDSIGRYIQTPIREVSKFVGLIFPNRKQEYEQNQYYFEILSEAKDKITSFAKLMKLNL